MSITDELNEIVNTKDEITAAINARGVTIEDTTPFSDYPSKIKNITGKVSTNNITQTGLNKFTISDSGIASNFYNGTCYLDTGFTFEPSSKPWKQYIQFTTGSTIKAAQGLYTLTGSGYGITPFYINSSGNLVAYLSSDGTSWDLCNADTIMTLSANTDYYLSCEYTGNEYIWQRNVDETWTTIYTLSNSTASINNPTAYQIGSNRGTGNYFRGTIDLTKFSLEIDGEVVYKPII